MHASLSKRLKEGGFLLLLAIGAYFLMALFSYSPDDPSWVFESAKQHADNAGGVAGAWAASVLFMLFGKVAYVFPLMIAWGGWLMFRERDDQQHSVYLRIARWIGFVLTVLSATALASLRMGGVDSLPEGPGGITGDLISSSGTAVLNEAGAILLLLTLLLIGITLFAGVSWLAVMDGVGGFLLNVWRQGVGLVGNLAEKRQASRMKQERQEVVKKEKQRKRDKPPPVIEKKEPEIRTSVRVEKERQMTLLEPEPNTELPPLGLLDPPQKSGKGLSTEALQALSGQVERKLADFGVSAEVTAVHPGPVVTLFELQLAPGTKASKVTNLSKDLARALSVVSVRVVEVIPGKTVIGLEIPNEYREMVHLSETLRSEPYDRSRSPLTLALGKDIVGEPVVADLAKMPHALIAGTTGSGKSVAVNAMILSLVYKATAEEIRLIMIDPKMLELSVYEGIPHLLTPVVTDMKEAANALRWCVAEMERRYRLMAALGVRNIAGFNKKVKDAAKAGEPIKDPLFKREPDPITGDLPEIPDLKTIPYIVVVIDEFADMMMVVGKKVEELIARLAQKARAAGVHLLLATQRPSVDVITGLIKANIPTRIAFQVSSRVDSRTILDQMGAESLLGHGDMLYLPAGTSIPQRIHGAFVDDHEVHRVVSHLKQSGKPNYVDEILQEPTEAIPGLSAEASGVELEDQDPLFDEAVNIVTESRRASVSGVQRRLKIGYNRAARLVEEMERIGIVTAADERGNREVLAPPPVKD
ncbi:MAG: DNA translocase FtsK 4TM domain-containing protein [Sedimenticolaceae bacterium]|nr:DNA translocase FtsK 4TM domain-containing protein [Chromatiaceae bacterium]MCP5439523.1 DNA translocase FtsK 4TM domain-containing protein [Chromatiaceae bacterium]HPE81317.1 DNA translocase FtsK 4TM domain-containing protein [Gammaproteobacteria bacterium]